MQRGLKIIQGPKDVGHIATLSIGKCVCGRGKDCALVLESAKVSKRHCEFSLTVNDFSVKDLGSSNGVYVNGERVTESNLRLTDHVQIGDYVLEVVGREGS